LASLLAKEINASNADLVNLHWVTDGFLSIEEISQIEKPLVWSMYDMWPFMGTEHYGPDRSDARWRVGYTSDNRPVHESGVDLDKWTYQRKLRSWSNRSPIHMIPASTWLQETLQESALMSSWRNTRIPHVVSDQLFAPMDRREARQLLGIDGEFPAILFLASAGIHDHRKGFDLLERAIPIVQDRFPDIRIFIAGPPDPNYVSPSDANVIWLGELTGDDELRSAYCAADVVAIPSREDNMPLTAMEAQTCGRSVVAFGIGGLTDIVADQASGLLVETCNTADLGDALSIALEDALGANRMGVVARERALAIWSPRRVVSKYMELYESVLG